MYVLGGLVLLAVGGEFLVRGAVQLAERLGVSPLVIGLTLVGFGTSTPELVASVQASMAGAPGIAVGNIVGSNIANILLILGVSALISPIAVSSRALSRDGGVVLATGMLFAVVGFTMELGRLSGLVFLGMLVGYIVYAWRQESVGADGHTAAFEKAQAFENINPGMHQGGAAAPGAGTGKLLLSVGMALGGILVVVLGGRLLVDGAIELARTLGIAESVIGLTIVAVGTSMPELVTSVVAAVRKQSDVALGNVLGSNIYNILGIGGVTGLIAPTVVPPEMVWFDSLVMVAVSALALAFAWTGMRIGRREGGVLLGEYVAYVWVIWP